MPGGVVEGRHLSNQSRKPGPAPPGFHLGAGLRHYLGEGLERLEALPRKRDVGEKI